MKAATVPTSPSNQSVSDQMASRQFEGWFSTTTALSLHFPTGRAKVGLWERGTIAVLMCIRGLSWVMSSLLKGQNSKEMTWAHGAAAPYYWRGAGIDGAKVRCRSSRFMWPAGGGA